LIRIELKTIVAQCRPFGRASSKNYQNQRFWNFRDW